MQYFHLVNRLLALFGIVVLGGASVALGPQQTTPTPLDPNNFTDKVTPHSTADLRLNRYSFEPGARTNWHSHEGGQVIIVEEGHMWVQERGGGIRRLSPREALVVGPKTVHAHGAFPGEPLKQVTLSYGATTWMDKVTDAEYDATVRR